MLRESFFTRNANAFRRIFSRQRYSDDFVQPTICRSIESEVSEDSHTRVPDDADMSPVYTSIKDEIKVTEGKPPLVSQQYVVYSFQYGLYDVGYTCRHLHQRIKEHEGSTIGKHLREQRDMEPEDIAQSFLILGKCQNKFDSLIFEKFLLSKNWNQR